ncbi:uncharacterized protein Dvir_GJ26240 [Drosophila virilis]|uniref:Uncharacterized protein n=1 Tax=Drosophila virilis TaxID=7244 RepID=A0A0Q9WBE1_DROVI|nr:uncharacterized protein Dvir_GJ26240 [Drosophila virilis]
MEKKPCESNTTQKTTDQKIIDDANVKSSDKKGVKQIVPQQHKNISSVKEEPREIDKKDADKKDTSDQGASSDHKSKMNEEKKGKVKSNKGNRSVLCTENVVMPSSQEKNLCDFKSSQKTEENEGEMLNQSENKGEIQKVPQQQEDKSLAAEDPTKLGKNMPCVALKENADEKETSDIGALFDDKTKMMEQKADEGPEEKKGKEESNKAKAVLCSKKVVFPSSQEVRMLKNVAKHH